MTFLLRPKVRLQEGVDSFPEITDYVLGMQFDTDQYPGRPQTIGGSLTLDNHDGRFTPSGSGEFSDYDWFQGLLRVDLEGFDDDVLVFSFRLFDAVITDVDVVEESVAESTVTVTFVDLLTVASRSSVQQPPIPSLITTTRGMFIDLVDGLVFDDDLVFPGAKASNAYAESPLTFLPVAFRQTIWDVQNKNEAQPRSQFVSFDSIGAGRIADVLIETVLPSGPSSVSARFASLVTAENPARPNVGLTNFRCSGRFFERVYTPALINRPFARLSTQRPQPEGTSPILSFKKGLNLSNLVNNCQMTMPVVNFVDINVEASDDLSVSEAGTRNIGFSKIGDPFGSGSGTRKQKKEILQSRASFWTKRFSTKRYDVTQFTVSSLSMVSQAETLEQVKQFVGLMSEPFHVAILDGNPYGVIGTKVNITAANITVRCSVLSGYDLQAFRVGDEVLGVIGKMRLG